VASQLRELFPGVAEEDDVRRMIIECMEYVGIQGHLIAPATRADLNTYLERLDLDLPHAGTSRQLHRLHLQTIHALFHKLERSGLQSLQRQILDTTRLVRQNQRGIGSRA
jgi:hypothetical protein